MKKIFLTAALLAGALVSHSLQADEPTETTEQRDARMHWFREAKFGMFIHWGVYSVPAGTYDGRRINGIGEWIMRNAKIPVATYRGYAKDFTASKYDPALWARIADDAGMKYVVITSKHHDGFALFDSKASDWNAVKASGAARDLIKPLAEAVRKQGLKFGLYYSQAQDWNNPGGAKAGMKDGEGWDDAHKGSMDDYLAKVSVPQVREILENYHPDVIWWDTAYLMTQERAKPLHDLLALQPGIITNNRLGGGYRGDTETPEQFIPPSGFPGRDWETCMTLNDTWGYKSYDKNWKSVTTLGQNLVDIVSKGGNYLLNVGPTCEGEIPPESIERLEKLGKWVHANADAIYATTASPFDRLPTWGRVTTKPGKLFLHVFTRPTDGKVILPMTGKVTKVTALLDPSKELPFEISDQGVTITLPEKIENEIATIFVATVDGDVNPIVWVGKADTSGNYILTAEKVYFTGANGLIETIDGKTNIGGWTNWKIGARWPINVEKPCKYSVELEYGVNEADAGCDYTIIAGDAKLSAKTQSTGEIKTFKTFTIGTLDLKTTGKVDLIIQPTGKKPEKIKALMNLRGVTLKKLAE